MDQLFLGQCESGRHDRLGEEGVESGVDLIAQIEHAVLDGHRLFGEEEMETGVLPQGGDRLWGDAGRVGFALLEDLGDQVGRFEVIVSLTRPGSLSLPGMAAGDGGSGQVEVVEEVSVGSPEGTGV